MQSIFRAGRVWPISFESVKPLRRVQRMCGMPADCRRPNRWKGAFRRPKSCCDVGLPKETN